MQPTIYVPLAQRTEPLLYTYFYIALRSSSDSPALLTRSVAAALTAVNPDLTMTFRPLATIVDESLAQDRLVAALAGFFGALALLLAGLGLYGVTAYAMARRRTEIGIRWPWGHRPRPWCGWCSRAWRALLASASHRRRRQPVGVTVC